MNWMTILWPMNMGACLTLSLINLRVAFGDQRRAAHLFFGTAALAVAAVSALELTLMQTTDVGVADMALRWSSLPVFLMILSTTAFVRNFFQTGRTWLAVTAVALIGLSQWANFFNAAPAVRRAVGITVRQAWGGAHFSVPVVASGWWTVIETIGNFALIAFVADAAIEVWRQRQRRRAAVVGGGVIFFLLVGHEHAKLVEEGLVRTPYLVSFAFLGMLVAIGIELTNYMLHARRLAYDLRESQQRNELIARAAALGFWTWDIAKDEIWANEAARSLLGFSPTEPLSLARFTCALHPNDAIHTKQAMTDALSTGNEYAHEFRICLPDVGSRWIASRGRADKDSNARPTFMQGIVMDITQQHESEMELQQLRRQLAHAGRVSMLGQLASALAHELNQPLGAILRNAETAEIYLRDGNLDLEELRGIIADIRSDDQRAGEVIDRLRSMLKRQDLEFRPVKVSDLFMEAMRLVQADAAMRHVTLEMSVDDDLPPVNGDRIHLQQVLLNLLLNAMDAICEHGKGPRGITLSATLDADGNTEVAVKDTGQGIAPEKLPYLFEPFFTTKQNGMGMGLAISNRIINAHDGHLIAENNADGCGATFRFKLPKAQPQ